ncbi:MAG: anthranilate synthase component I [Actinobacteria bacterium]|nr:anthranilate synthase component I [Actinomycetota bacterium]
MPDLYRPTRDEFLALVAGSGVVPVWREVLADLYTPLGVYDRLRGDGPTFLLESVEHGERWGRYSFIGLDPILSVRARDGQVSVVGDVDDAVHEAAATGDPLATVDAILRTLATPRDVDGLPPLFAGLVGYLGYDVVRWIEDIPAAGVDDLRFDDARLDLPGRMVAFDHLRQRLIVVTNVLIGDDPAAQYQRAVDESEALVVRLDAPLAVPAVAPPEAVTVSDADANMPRRDYERSVRIAKDHITAGDAFQIVPSLRFQLDTDVEAEAIYRVLRVINPSPYMYLLDWPDQQVVGSSPEALVKLTGRTAQTWPIAGSRPRGATPAQDAEFEKSLLADEKERAEHVMLVDLARNDLGRVCEIGSIAVEPFMSVARYSHIMHLWSGVSGTLRDDVAAVDLVRATFPAGTLSGAPKVRAMQVIDELEPTRRGPYGGGVGYLSLSGDIDLCITIRTLLLRAGHAYVQAGAGVVADSDPAREYEECRNKAMALLAAVRAAERFGEGDPEGEGERSEPAGGDSDGSAA